MAAGEEELDLECSQKNDTCPLLMDRGDSLPSIQERVLTILPGNTQGLDERAGLYSHANLANSSSDTVISVGPHSPPTILSGSSHSEMMQSPGLYGSSGSHGWHNDAYNYAAHQRTNPLNSGLWISIELTITISQIVASIIVLFLSRNEKPKAPLSVWVAGYATGCLATLPLLYWRYAYHYGRQSDQDPHVSRSASSSSSSSLATPYTSYGTPEGRSLEAADGTNTRITVHMERFKISLDCFFAIWFVVGNVWIFGGHSFSREAPNLYRLCIVFLTFSCIGYAMPFVICATMCCCLPCLITILGFQEEHSQTKGAAPEVIEALPKVTFKRTCKLEGRGYGIGSGDGSERENLEEEGVIAAGTDKERQVSAEDAVCCICLGKYKDDVELRELPCTHFFHVVCVDKWLKINATCPLCKHGICGSSEESGEAYPPAITNVTNS